MPACHGGRSKMVLTPRPLEIFPPSPQMLSDSMAEEEALRWEPPTAVTQGLDAGKSTAGWPFDIPSVRPWSPEEASTVMPRSDALFNSAFMDVMVSRLQVGSGPPQLTERTEG